MPLSSGAELPLILKEGVVSSSVIVTTEVLSAIVALLGFESCISNVSLISSMLSCKIGIEIVSVVEPELKVTVPVSAV